MSLKRIVKSLLFGDEPQKATLPTPMLVPSRLRVEPPATVPLPPHWQVQVTLTEDAQADAAWQEKLKETIIARLPKLLAEQPEATQFTFRIPPLYAVTVELAGEPPMPSERGTLPIRLAHFEHSGFLPKRQEPPPTRSTVSRLTTHSTRMVTGGGKVFGDGGKKNSTSNALVQSLPSEEMASLGSRLVGMEAIHQEVLWYLTCFYDQQLEQWAERTQQSLPPGMQATFTSTVPLFLFNGDPGTGKSALSRVIADSYCRLRGITGAVLTVGTETRGNGLVGAFSQEVRRAFEGLLALPDDGLKVLILEEADAIVMRRSESASHQEDRAATSTILQCLDALPTQDKGRFLIILTTNRLDAIDPAVQRRCTRIYSFQRPGPEARAALIGAWISESKAIPALVKASEGMTPRDIERGLQAAFVTAIQKGVPVTSELARERLQQAVRTQEV
ncbi:AAA family ATPase [Armatimonas rosea]|nr:AAA family ATPase [Armatimonas rosea]